jgi:hypothetical protein
MPSREQMAIRRTEAYDRLNRGLRRLSKRLDIEPAEVAGRSKDKDLAAVIELEQMADAVESFDTRIKDGGIDVAALKEQLAEFAETFNADPFVIDLEAAYAAYDADERAHGPDDFAAFCDAVNGAINAEEGTVESVEAEDDERGEDSDADAAPAETDAAENDDATAPAPAANGASTPADAQKRPTRARTGTKD